MQRNHAKQTNLVFDFQHIHSFAGESHKRSKLIRVQVCRAHSRQLLVLRRKRIKRVDKIGRRRLKQFLIAGATPICRRRVVVEVLNLGVKVLAQRTTQCRLVQFGRRLRVRNSQHGPRTIEHRFVAQVGAMIAVLARQLLVESRLFAALPLLVVIEFDKLKTASNVALLVARIAQQCAQHVVRVRETTRHTVRKREIVVCCDTTRR
mmetsp:Transcript_33/g.53  ORF Transcript_33/g.53 Transcript_33/m.53 type:complete len:206 (-) Transcript_33:856-1473(-)